jgi:EAL domain-containing protein (putative c-di-GMP-specific phosphodiesterase class I)
VVEVVETDQMQIEHALQQIDALHRLGIKTHLDDFGTAYSNIETLARLPIDGVKLDRSFAMAAAGSLMAKMLVNAIDMIHSAGHKVTVEEVESKERLQMLYDTGQVDYIQGYHFSRPVDIHGFVRFIAESKAHQLIKPSLAA